MKRTARVAVCAVAVAAAFLALGCQKKEAGARGPLKTVKAGFVYVGPIGDLGFTNAHDAARVALQAKLPWLKTKFIESVPEGKASPVISQFVQDEKMDVVFTCSFGYMDETIEAGAKYAAKIFEHCSGFKRSDNVGTYFADLYQMYYLNGLMAGALTKSNKVGYVGAFPIPEVIRHIDAFALGVRDANPKATVDVRWIFSWYDPAKAREAAQALISAGVDALAFTEDSATVVEVGQESVKAGKMVYTFGHYSPMLDKGPDSCVSGQLVNWTPLYEKILTDIHEGKWKSEDYFWLAAEGAADLGGKFGVPINPAFEAPLKAYTITTPDLGKISAYDLVMKRLEQMKQAPVGFEPFTGPIKDQAGKEVYAAGAKASLADLTSINYFVSNVVGKIPASN
jgi:simple sugar transport system substrate-binding protein